MARLPGLDPEVLADLRARDASERDRTRSALVCCDRCEHHVRDHDQASGACDVHGCECQEFERGGGPTWSPPAIVERWPCTGCNTLVEVTQEAIDLHAMFNRQLARQGKQPLARRIPCAACKARDEELAQAQRRPMKQIEMPGTSSARSKP
jgi:hypothetical protein